MTFSNLYSFILLISVQHVISGLDENTSEFWLDAGQETLTHKLLNYGNLNTAKNVIFFLGDGMSIPTVAAARIYKGQKENKTGESSKLAFEEFPYVGLSKTYCIDKQVADSACSATAYLSGIKGNYKTIGVNGKVKLFDCAAAKDKSNHGKSLLYWAQKSGRSTGVVTTTRITHASPCGTYGHTSNRDMESDYDIWKLKKDPLNSKVFTADTSDCEDIASQLVYHKPGRNINVLLGGGRSKFLSNSSSDSTGERLDGKNLIEDWKLLRNCEDCYAVVENRKQLLSLDVNKIDYVLGLFNDTHMSYNLDNVDKKEPSLEEMTETAIQILSKNPKGYFLFVEGGKIDLGHHDNLARIALDETLEFSNAIEKATRITNEEDTLIVVTSDHAHTMSFSGYPERGADILGLTKDLSDVDNLPYTTLSYANGQGYVAPVNGVRQNLSKVDLSDKKFKYPALVPLKDETHGGDDVGVFARGPWSNLFTGVYEQNAIPHLVQFASCMGEGITLCSQNSDQPKV